jgi:hypothetical protein
MIAPWRSHPLLHRNIARGLHGQGVPAFGLPEALDVAMARVFRAVGEERSGSTHLPRGCHMPRGVGRGGDGALLPRLSGAGILAPCGPRTLTETGVVLRGISAGIALLAAWQRAASGTRSPGSASRPSRARFDTCDMLAAAALDRATVENPDARLPAGTVMALWNALRERSGDPALQLAAPTTCRSAPTASLTTWWTHPPPLARGSAGSHAFFG